MLCPSWGVMLDFIQSPVLTFFNMTHLTAKELRRAADIKDKIESLQNELSRLLRGVVRKGATPVRKRRKMSAAAKAKIAAAARVRWAKWKAEKK